MRNYSLFNSVLIAVIAVAASQVTTQKTTRKKGCSGYGFQIWLSCITDPCVFSSCPAFGKMATCSKEVTDDCKHCRATFSLNGRRVDHLCHTNFECPEGLPLQRCTTDPCVSTECLEPRFQGARCRGYYCGACLAEYYVDGRWQQCPNPDVKLQGDAALLLPEIQRAMIQFPTNNRRRTGSSSPLALGSCPDGTPEPECPTNVCARAECPQFASAQCVVNKCQGCKAEFYFRGQLVNCQSNKCRRNVLEMHCHDDPCKYATCPLFPAAECRPSSCGYCHPEWFLGEREVNCFSRMPDNYQCPNGLKQQQCPRNTCRFKRCLTDADTFCRINNCGGCYAEYVNTKNEIVDCEGWWTSYETKKPKELTQAENITTITASSSTGGETSLTKSDKAISLAKKQMEIDALFGNLGLEVPSNSKIVSSSVDSNPTGNNPWETTATKQRPSQTQTVETQKNVKQEPIPIETVKPIVMSSQTLHATNINRDTIIKSPRTVPQGKKEEINISQNIDENKQQISSNRWENDKIKSSQSGPKPVTRNSRIREPPKPLTRNAGNRQLSKPLTRNAGNREPSKSLTSNAENREPSQMDLFRSIAIPLDSLNKGSNFRPGVPIGGFRFTRR
ncbi:uncharacterized protein LOC127732563 [Mytilus californianus]|uniref:uncharacterized protein LOC127732563 n=1 Tax=Mytilus californianus TaxID=6549 RepID=UPI002246EE59|nr:uncharacterized protein LOC127732563 [Mytilus californianus]